MNYSGLPVFDILFGTFRNPCDHALVQAFHDGAGAGDLAVREGA